MNELVVKPADRDPTSGTIYAELKDIATGRTLAFTLGPNHREILERLYREEGTLQSHSRTNVATLGGDTIGHIGCILFREYRPRRRASARIVCSLSRIAGLRSRVDSIRRTLTGTQLGLWRPGQLYIQTLAVQTTARRQGVATAMLAFAARLARDHACDELSLDTMDTNHAAVGLYEANGFAVRMRSGHYLKLAKSLEQG